MRIARVSVPGVEFPVYGVITGEKIELIKPKLEGIINGGLITEEKIRIIYYEGKN